MLTIVLNQGENFNEQTETFTPYSEMTLQLEHSLISISKWESKWKKSFLNTNDKTSEELFDYVRCMVITKNVPESTYHRLTQNHIRLINEYIEDPHTATTIKNSRKGGSREVITSEVIYYSMIALQIPMECQKWHLNRLLTLIEVCRLKQTPGKKMSKREILSNYKSINAKRQAELGTKGQV